MAGSCQRAPDPRKTAQARRCFFGKIQCFLLQQAAEKAIKAVYQHKGLLFRYTHDLEELGTGLESSGIPIPPVVKEAVILTRYAFETRYPGPFDAVTEQEYQEAVRLAEAVVTWAKSIITGASSP